MKEFMLIFLGADYSQLDLSPEESQGQMQKWFQWVDNLRKDDIYVEGRPLAPLAKRMQGKDLVITDGPFAETKELVGGYFIVKAKDFEAAAEIAKDYPDFHLGGGVEIREVMMMDHG
ncbi:MAG: YciI family protein [Saprospiraceae bacterium]|nr:YciI family protein [Saprospiraceae bacterium]